MEKNIDWKKNIWQSEIFFLILWILQVKKPHCGLTEFECSLGIIMWPKSSNICKVICTHMLVGHSNKNLPKKSRNWQFLLFNPTTARRIKVKKMAKQKFKAKEICERKRKPSRSGASAVVAPLPGFGRSKSGPPCRNEVMRLLERRLCWWTCKRFCDVIMFWIF